MKRAFWPLLAAVLILPAGYAAEDPIDTPTEEQNIQAYMDLLVEDLQGQKVSIISQMMEFTPEDAAKFWPLYEGYSKELEEVGRQRIANIEDYAENFESMTDDMANQLVDRAYEIQAQRLEVRKKFHERLKGAMPGKLVGRFFQVEQQILLLIDLQLAASLPIVER